MKLRERGLASFRRVARKDELDRWRPLGYAPRERERLPRWVVGLIFLVIIVAGVALWVSARPPAESGPMIFTPLAG